jgi:hypothetical protein
MAPQVPAHVRVILYWIAYCLGTVSSLFTGGWAIVAAASPDVTLPIWLAITQASVTLLTSQLHQLAQANVSPAELEAD